MPRGDKSGSLKQLDDGRWLVVKKYVDRKGRDKKKSRLADSRVKANRLMTALVKEIDDELAGLQTPDSRLRTFRQVAVYCKENIFTPPVYDGLTKLSGLRSHEDVHRYVDSLVRFFGPMEFDLIEYEDVVEYRDKRLRKKTHRGTTRKAASVNRELAYLRRIFKIGIRKKWRTAGNPFAEGDPLIQVSREVKKERIISVEEEQRLLAAAAADWHRVGHLPFAITMALETGMRMSEQFRLTDEDIRLEQRVLIATSYKGKVAKKRFVAITDVLYPQLKTFLDERSDEDRLTGRVFWLQNPKKSFATTCRDAGVEGVTWHTLRHTAITRMVHVWQMDPHAVMKNVGHDNWKTFWETYVNVNEEMARAFGERLDAARAKSETATVAPSQSLPEPPPPGAAIDLGEVTEVTQ
jgi:integrase